MANCFSYCLTLRLFCTCIEPCNSLWLCFKGVCIALTNASINENSSIFITVHVFKPSHNKEPLQLQYNCNEVTEMSLVLRCFVVDTSQDALRVTSGNTKEGEEQSVQQSLLFTSCY